MSPELRFRTQRVNLKLMTQQSGGSYVDDTVGSQTNGYQTDAERFPDPKRNWKRTGSLLGGWVLTLVAVFGLGISWNLFFSSIVTHDPATEPVDARTSARMFFQAVYEDADADAARSKQCADYQGEDPADLIAEIDGQWYDPDIEIVGNGESLTVTVKLYDDAPFQQREYRVRGSDSSSCVESVEYDDA